MAHSARMSSIAVLLTMSVYSTAFAQLNPPPSAPPPEQIRDRGVNLNSEAERLASMAAADAVQQYGRQEHFIFQFLAGFRESVLNGNKATLQESFNKGFASGREMAEKIAESKMPQIAREHAATRAMQDALARHRKAVNQGSVDAVVRVPKVRLDREEITKLGGHRPSRAVLQG